MTMIATSIAALLLLAAGTGVLFYVGQEPVYQAQPLPSVRVGDPGHNLVGPNWSGRNRAEGGSGLAARTVSQADPNRK